MSSIASHAAPHSPRFLPLQFLWCELTSRCNRHRAARIFRWHGWEAGSARGVPPSPAPRPPPSSIDSACAAACGET
jgi:hypothetical protein